MRRTALLLAAIVLVVVPAALAGDQSLRDIGEGRGLYLKHCAQCHGGDGKGMVTRGDQVVPVPDLTRIEMRDGKFRTLHVATHIGGQPQLRKADDTMPCWSKALQADHPHGDGWAQVRVMQLTKYLESIQEP